MSTNENTLEELVSLAISIIGSDRFDDVDPKDEEQVTDRIEMSVAAVGDDLTRFQKNALRLLLSAYDETAELCDESNGTIRLATMAEAVESGLASDEGWITVDDVTCYVAG
jgi:hypothetical protein